MHMQTQSAASRELLCCYFGFNSPPAIILSLHIPKMSEGGVSATFDSPPSPQGKKRASYFQSDTLNFGTGRSVSLYLVQRRPILGSRTMSTGGIPGFCRRGGGGETQYCYPSHSQLHTARTCCKVVRHKPDAVFC